MKAEGALYISLSYFEVGGSTDGSSRRVSGFQVDSSHRFAVFKSSTTWKQATLALTREITVDENQWNNSQGTRHLPLQAGVRSVLDQYRPPRSWASSFVSVSDRSLARWTFHSTSGQSCSELCSLCSLGTRWNQNKPLTNIFQYFSIFQQALYTGT